MIDHERSLTAAGIGMINLIRHSMSVIIATVALFAAGCTPGEPTSDPNPHTKETPMMTYQQAADTVEQLIQETVAAMNPMPRLESVGRVLAAPCAGPNDDQETGTSMVEHGYWLRDIDPALNNEIFRQVRQYWSDHGYTVSRESGKVGDPFHTVVVHHPENGFRVVFTNSHDVLIIEAQSNCVPTPES